MVNVLLNVAGQVAMGHAIAAAEKEDIEYITNPMLGLSFANQIFNYSWPAMSLLGLGSFATSILFGGAGEYWGGLVNKDHIFTFMKIANFITTIYLFWTVGFAAVAVTLGTYAVCKLGQNGYLTFEPANTINNKVLKNKSVIIFTASCSAPGLWKVVPGAFLLLDKFC